MSLNINNRFKLSLFLILVSVLWFNFSFAQESDTYQINWSAFPQNGGFIESPTYEVFQSVGFQTPGKMKSYTYSVGATKVFLPNRNKRIPNTFELKQNYPNPFNPSTTIVFELPQTLQIELIVYNVLGQKVKNIVNRKFQPGVHHVVWDGTNDKNMRVSSGTYIFLIFAKSNNKTLYYSSKKMTLVY
ncbi:T9SS type A sorting domain-containing protein [candidate division KSB1 bacterium]|nr:T9SS type A sorting domain-containing protein [candidate division KSB1 bacterium]